MISHSIYDKSFKISPFKSLAYICIDISKKNFLQTFHSEFSYNEVWLTDQNSKPLEIGDEININLVVN